ESPEGKLNGGEGHEGGQGLGKIFHIVGETPVSSQPGERALDDPAARAISSSSRRARSARPGCGRTTMWDRLYRGLAPRHRVRAALQSDGGRGDRGDQPRSNLAVDPA